MGSGSVPAGRMERSALTVERRKPHFPGLLGRRRAARHLLMEEEAVCMTERLPPGWAGNTFAGSAACVKIHYFFLITASEAVCVSSEERSGNRGAEASDGEDTGGPAPAGRWLKGCRVACSKGNHLGLGTHADGN